MKKIKVCHMTSVHSPEDGRIFRKECTSLANAGYETYLIQQGDTYDKNGVHIIGFGKPETNRFKRMVNSTSKVYKLALKVNADIYHFHDPELLPVGLKLKKKGKKVIFDSHEDTSALIMEKKYIPGLLRKMVSKTYRAFERHICKRLDGVIYVTPNFKEYFESLNKNCVMLTNYPIVEDGFVEPDYNSKRLFFAGMVIPLWHHHNILSAMNKIDGVSYTLCGNANQEYLSSLKRKDSWEKVDYLGRVDYSTVKEEMQKSSIGICILGQSLNNGGSMGCTKMFEEMMAGLPVICSDYKYWKEIIEDNNCGICVSPDDTKGIYKAINKLVNDPQTARIMGLNGRRLVETKYNWENEEKKLLSFYSLII